MKTRYLDKQGKFGLFGNGPWMDEPDHAQWRHRVTDMPCIAVRMSTGAWAGYVGVSPSHPLHRVSHHELYLVESIVVSGNDYGRWMLDGTEVELDADPTTWWFGFDYSHGEDLIPLHEKWSRDHQRHHIDEVHRVPLRSLGEGSEYEAAYADFTFIRMRAERQAEQLEYPENIPRRSL